jgi:thiamine biosynthesis lipoprotein
MSGSVARFTAMGCEVLVAGATGAELDAVERLFAERDRRFSRFLPDSELNRVNGRSGGVTTVSAPFAEMLAVALWAAEQTDGLVDPTLGQAIVAAGYDRDFAQLHDQPLPPAPGGPGRWRDLHRHGLLVRAPEGLLLDLNGVVKSHTVDAALELLSGDGWVSAGGDVAARGGVDVALPGGGAVHLETGSLATSGRGRRSWRRAGVTQHHLIDPATGAPSRSCWEQVTVSGARCLDADLAAKAAFLLSEPGPRWLDDRGLPGRFLDTAGGVAVNRSWRDSLQRHEAAACI